MRHDGGPCVGDAGSSVARRRWPLAGVSPAAAPRPRTSRTVGRRRAGDPDAVARPGRLRRGIDNPWLPLEPGSDVDLRRRRGDEPGRSTVTVEPTRPAYVAGVDGRRRSRTDDGAGRRSPRRPATQDVDYYAQDRDGNVWWFGRDGRRGRPASTAPRRASPCRRRRGSATASGWRSPRASSRTGRWSSRPSTGRTGPAGTPRGRHRRHRPLEPGAASGRRTPGVGLVEETSTAARAASSCRARPPRRCWLSSGGRSWVAPCPVRCGVAGPGAAAASGLPAGWPGLGRSGWQAAGGCGWLPLLQRLPLLGLRGPTASRPG